MCGNSIEDEVIKYKDSSQFKIKMMIMVYKTLRFLAGDSYFFVFSLFIILSGIVYIKFSVLGLFFGMIIHYTLFWNLLRPILDRIFKTNQEIYEINDIIKVLESYLKNKNPN
jgi:hypothetical protein